MSSLAIRILSAILSGGTMFFLCATYTETMAGILVLMGMWLFMTWLYQALVWMLEDVV